LKKLLERRKTGFAHARIYAGCFFLFLMLTFSNAHTQTLGGNTAYNFLKLPYATGLTNAGGINITQSSSDVSIALNNPALLRPSLHAQAGLNFTQLFAGIKAYHLAGAYFDAARNTTLGAQVLFLNYGQFPATDAAGNEMGQFRATDYVVQLSAGRAYLERWHYGASLKFILSAYQQYRSAAAALDVGVQYFDSVNGVSIAVLAKNMGLALKSYAGTPDELPFELQFGITKKLAAAPFAFSATVQQAHRFDILYNDTTFAGETGFSTSTSLSNKLLLHLVVAAHIYISKQLEATVGYNHLRRNELSMGTAGNGLAGFSAGVAARFEKLQISYARATYQRGIAYNQLGLNLSLNKMFGAGNF
jgi:hypothetical protein